MTEDEAKKKWCPMLRTSRDEAGYCIGSACMVWRWRLSPLQAESAAREAPMAHARSPFVARGFCGLAGAPQ